MRRLSSVLAVLAALAPVCAGQAFKGKVFRAGAYAADVSPPKLPAIINGGFLERIGETARDPLFARSLVLDDGTTRVAIVVVDSCMMPRELLDQAKQLASEKTRIPANRMLISATHTHSAPAAMGCLGTDADPNYVPFLPGRIAEAIERAAGKLAPARIGWAVIDDFEHTHCRRWIFRSDKIRTDPFGARTVRANMHPGYENPDTIAPSGPVDPGLSVLSVQSPEGRPVALLANYSMHYFGAQPVSADYYGLFAEKMRQRVAGASTFVAMMSQGTSGDQMWMDYGKPKSDLTLETYAEGVARAAQDAYQKVQYRAWVPLAMEETALSLRRRVPDSPRLAWARELLAKMEGRKPLNQPEVYAREQVFLHEQPGRELKLQALRIGDLGITGIPNEVFAISGLKIKALSPLATTFNIELANGAEGYIPPPEQHKLGGYTTWPARTAALEVQAEPRIVETVLGLLEKASGRPQKKPAETHGPYARAVLASRPLAYWRLSEFAGPAAADAAGRYPAQYEDGVVFCLPGPASPNFSGPQINRCPHFAGGRLNAALGDLADTYSVEMWFWNGLPADARPVTGYLFSRGSGDEVSLGGGKLRFQGLAGGSEIAVKTWHHVVLVREGRKARVYLNGKAAPEISGEAPVAGGSQIFIGGRNDRVSAFEGKIDEVAIYGRALSPAEVARHYKASGF